ncbi:plant UBX domain-containing protein 2 [Impatiens glandulifera]|uniref:plant UBX domain-containing protein 2 n=1 Tax=Impatiens glandulifera TaxID=253017 RepID=UPI001FB079C8|nr:plant UBX domain-containing protein 2 [Impatiens glandulifera]
MDDVKDKMKGLFKKVNNSLSSSSSGKFKGQGRVLGSSSSSEPTNPKPNPVRPRLLSDSRPSQSTISRPQPEKTSGSYPESKVSESGSVSSSNGEQSDGFDPFNSLITSGKRNPNGYSLNIIECPVCGLGFGSEEEVSDHVDSCLSNSNVGSQTLNDNQELPVVVVPSTEVHNEFESCIANYVSGKPADSSKQVLIRLLSNIVKEPENSKFRRIRLGNPKIKEAICEAAGGVDLLECVGFELKEEDGEMWAVMDVLSQDKLVLVQKAVSLLEPPPPKASPPPPAKELPVVPEKIDRQVRVFFSVSENIAARIHLPDSFYNISPEEARREAEMRRKKMAESQLLIPKSYKEQKAQAAKKRYTKSLIRVQFPDGVVLQAVFSPREPTSALYEFVSSALKDPSLEFELLHPVVIKRRVIPHFSTVGGKPVSLEDEELVPTALVKFRPIETDDSVFTGLCNELLMKSEPLS